MRRNVKDSSVSFAIASLLNKLASERKLTCPPWRTSGAPRMLQLRDWRLGTYCIPNPKTFDHAILTLFFYNYKDSHLGKGKLYAATGASFPPVLV